MPKALVTLGGTPLVTHAVRRLVASGGVSHVVVTVPAGHEPEFDAALREFGPGARPDPDRGPGTAGDAAVRQAPARPGDAGVAGVCVTCVPGGAERSDSVRCGLRALDRSCDVVLVHDAARCLAPASLVRRVVRSIDAGADAVIPGLAVSDTIKVVSPVGQGVPPDAVGDVVETLDAVRREAGDDIALVESTPARSDLRAIQTPQGFRRSALVAAHESGLDATDDAALVERSGGRVVVIEGDVLALKITTPLDVVIAEHLLADLSEADPA